MLLVGVVVERMLSFDVCRVSFLVWCLLCVVVVDVCLFLSLLVDWIVVSSYVVFVWC